MTAPAIVCLALLTTSQNSDPAGVEKLLFSGTREQSMRTLETRYAADSNDVNAFALAVAQLLAAGERAGQSLVKAGLINRLVEIEEMTQSPSVEEPAAKGHARDAAKQAAPAKEKPKHRLATFIVEQPTRVNRDVIDGWIAAFEQDVTKAEATLARIKDPAFRFPVHRTSLDSLAFDFNGNGRLDAQENSRDWGTTAPAHEAKGEKQDDTLVVVDLGDVYWLRGYCHFLLGLAGAIRALDGKELIDKTGHALFPNLESPYAFLTPRGVRGTAAAQYGVFGDYAAWFWLAGRLTVYRPEKLRGALEHLRQCVACTKEAFRLYRAETDDDHEWIPNPRQKKSAELRQLTEEQFAAWEAVLEECDLVLAGKKLVPHWRVADGRAINLRRIFTEPGKTFEPVLWFQGSAAVPYLEHGATTDPKFWERTTKVFGEGYGIIGYAVWLN